MALLTKDEILDKGWELIAQADDSILAKRDDYELFYTFDNRVLQIMKNWRGTKETVFKGICLSLLDLVTIEIYVIPFKPIYI